MKIQCPCGKKIHSRELCRTCYNRQWNFHNKMKASYYHLKSNAKAREIEFMLTFEQWKEFCEETGYLEKCGRGNDFATVDRRNSNSGYHFWNIQCLTLRENIHKYYSQDQFNNEPPPEEIYCPQIPQVQVAPKEMMCANEIIHGDFTPPILAFKQQLTQLF